MWFGHSCWPMVHSCDLRLVSGALHCLEKISAKSQFMHDLKKVGNAHPTTQERIVAVGRVGIAHQRVLAGFLHHLGIEFVVKRFEADAQLLSGSGFVAIELVERGVNGFHLQFFERATGGVDRYRAGAG